MSVCSFSLTVKVGKRLQGYDAQEHSECFTQQIRVGNLHDTILSGNHLCQHRLFHPT